jgi:hypothetical protein
MGEFLLSVKLYIGKEFRSSSGDHSLNINMEIHSVAERGALNSATLLIDPKHRLGLLKLFAETTKTS